MSKSERLFGLACDAIAGIGVGYIFHSVYNQHKKTMSTIYGDQYLLNDKFKYVPPVVGFALGFASPIVGFSAMALAIQHSNNCRLSTIEHQIKNKNIYLEKKSD